LNAIGLIRSSLSREAEIFHEKPEQKQQETLTSELQAISAVYTSPEEDEEFREPLESLAEAY